MARRAARFWLLAAWAALAARRASASASASASARGPGGVGAVYGLGGAPVPLVAQAAAGEAGVAPPSVVVLAAGESNAAGAGAAFEGGVLPVGLSLSGVAVWEGGGADVWRAADVASAGRPFPALHFAAQLAQRTGRRVGVVRSFFMGSINYWLGEGACGPVTDLYAVLSADVRAALAKSSAPALAAVLWQHGEADSCGPWATGRGVPDVSAAGGEPFPPTGGHWFFRACPLQRRTVFQPYAWKLSRLVGRLRADFGDALVLLGEPVRGNELQAVQTQDVRRFANATDNPFGKYLAEADAAFLRDWHFHWITPGLREVADRLENVLFVPSDGLGANLDLDWGLHFDTDAVQRMGERMFKAFAARAVRTE